MVEPDHGLAAQETQRLLLIFILTRLKKQSLGQIPTHIGVTLINIVQNQHQRPLVGLEQIQIIRFS